MNRSMTRSRAARNVRADAFVAQMQRTDRAELAAALERQNMAEIERAAIAHRIKQARKEAGLSQPEMAEALGVIARTYQNYESVKEPRTPWSLMNDIATITGKSTEWLIHGDRPTPDLLGVAERDQVDGGFEEFREHVAELNAKLDRIEALLVRVAAAQAHALDDDDLRRTLMEIGDFAARTEPADADAPTSTRARTGRGHRASG